MGKKSKPTPVVSETAPLKHSPFAGLRPDDGPAPAPAAQPVAAEQRAPIAPPEAGREARGRLVLRRETKRRGGKAVVIIAGFEALPDFDAAAIAELARACKQALGCGGTVDGSEIVLQGDRAGDVSAWLRERGFRVAGVTG